MVSTVLVPGNIELTVPLLCPELSIVVVQRITLFSTAVKGAHSKKSVPCELSSPSHAIESCQ